MVSKKELLKNLRSYSPEEIAEAVRNGNVSLYELSKDSEGAFTSLLKKQVKAILDNPVVPSPVTTENPDSSISSNSVESPVKAEAMQVIPTETTVPLPSEPEEIETVISEEVKNKKGMFRNPFSFHGRIRRTEYGISFIIYYIWITIGNVMMENPESSLGAILFVLLPLVPMMWFMLAQGCKRCHDRDNSGWYQIIPFYFFVLLFGDSEEGENCYGENPKE